MMKKILSLIILFVLLAACTPGTGQETGETPTTAADGAGTTTPLDTVTSMPDPAVDTRGDTPTAEATKPGEGGELPADAAIVFRREGGMEGLTEAWTLYQDGRIVD